MENYESAEELSNKLDSVLEEYCDSRGIKRIKINNDGDEFIEMSSQKLRSLTASECATGSYLVSQRAYFVQLEYNKENGRAKWAKSIINKMIADRLQNYKGYSYEERSQQAIRDNSFTQKLQNIMIMAQNRADILYSLSERLMSISRALSGLQYTKGGNRNAD